MIKLKALLQENISTSLLKTIKKDPSLKKLGMVNVTAGTEIAYGSTKAPLTIFIDPSKTKIDDVYFDIKDTLNKISMPITRFNVMTGPTGIGNPETGAIHYAPDTKPDPAQDAYNRIYDMTDDFNNSRPLSYMEDEMYHQDNSIKRMHDDFLENPDKLSMSQKKKLAVVYNQIADELENEKKFG
tara:strand:- start:479 stop:1030 length:552 start_codon:yes stop_codon:yes gene_type:complete